MQVIGRLFICFVFGTLFVSCSPVYKVEHDLIPPKTAQGLQCLKGCQGQLTQCNAHCSRRFKQCAIKAEQQARKELPGLLQAYPQKLASWQAAKERYERDLEWYEFRRDLAEARRDRCLDSHKKGQHCFGGFGYRYDLFAYDLPQFTEPRPVKPTLANVTAKIRALSCRKDCACDAKYRLCYSSCGGLVKSKKVCIKNCIQ